MQRLHHEVRGDGPVVLLTHGFAATSSMFAGAAEALSADHTVVTWDLPGHGRSEYPTDPSAYSPERVVADMAGLLDDVGADRAVIAGHSVGGFLSLRFHLEHPDRVRALVLIGTGPGYRRDDARQQWNDMAERYAAAFERKGLAALGESEELDMSAHRSAEGLPLAARGFLRQYDSRVVDSLPDIAVPTLVVVGERDRQFLDGSRYLAAKVPDATLVEIPGAGHAPNISYPDAFEDAIRGFLKGLP